MYFKIFVDKNFNFDFNLRGLKIKNNRFNSIIKLFHLFNFKLPTFY